MNAAPARPAPSRGTLWATLGASVVTISAAAPLIIAANAPAPTTSLWRMALAGVVLMAWALVRERRHFATLSARDGWALFAAGNLLAMHYLFWIGSLSRTSVVSSTVLVTTNPLWVGVGAWLFLREPPSVKTWIAIVVGIAGAILLGVADASGGVEHAAPSLAGDAMALGAALAGSGTMLFGRKLRARIPTILFQGVVCMSAVPLVVVACLVTHSSPVPVDLRQGLLLLSIVVFPQLVGNTILSWALGYMTAPRVALVILGEPIGASLLAWMFLGQVPAPIALPGSALVLFAVVLDVIQPAPKPAAPPPL